LIQEGWLHLICAANSWQPDSGSKTLIGFARSQLAERMAAYGRRQINVLTAGNSPFVVPIKVCDLRGGTNIGKQVTVTVLPTKVSAHALTRYRKRFNPAGTRRDILTRLKRSVPVSAEVDRAIRGGKMGRMHDLALRDGDAIFLLVDTQFMRGVCRPTVTTILSTSNVTKREGLRPDTRMKELVGGKTWDKS